MVFDVSIPGLLMRSGPNLRKINKTARMGRFKFPVWMPEERYNKIMSHQTQQKQGRDTSADAVQNEVEQTVAHVEAKRAKLEHELNALNAAQDRLKEVGKDKVGGTPLISKADKEDFFEGAKNFAMDAVAYTGDVTDIMVKSIAVGAGLAVGNYLGGELISWVRGPSVVIEPDYET